MIPKPLIAVGLPGAGSGGLWLIHWNMLFARLLTEYSVLPCYGMGANIYEVRNRCIPQWDALPANRPVEYMLWIDSDNLVTWDDFAKLRAALVRNPQLDMVAGWAWTQDVMGDEESRISAGYWNQGKAVNLQVEGIEESAKADELIPVEWTGLCFSLIRSDSLKRLGPKPFLPIPLQSEGTMLLLSEDESFCLLARQAGLNFAVHPGVEVPHLKPKPIRPELSARIDLISPEVIVQGDAKETGTPLPEEVRT